MSSMTLVTWAPGLAGCQRPFSPHEHVWVPLADLGGDILHILLADSAMHNPQSLWHSLWECDVWHHEEKKKKKKKESTEKTLQKAQAPVCSAQRRTEANASPMEPHWSNFQPPGRPAGARDWWYSAGVKILMSSSNLNKKRTFEKEVWKRGKMKEKKTDKTREDK